MMLQQWQIYRDTWKVDQNHYSAVVDPWFEVWSAICFKIMTRFTCGFLSLILAIFSALWVFFPTTSLFSSHASVDSVLRKRTLNKHAYICAQHEPIHKRCKQTRVWGHGRSLYKVQRIIPSATVSQMLQNSTTYIYVQRYIYIQHFIFAFSNTHFLSTSIKIIFIQQKYSFNFNQNYFYSAKIFVQLQSKLFYSTKIFVPLQPKRISFDKNIVQLHPKIISFSKNICSTSNIITFIQQ